MKEGSSSVCAMEHHSTASTIHGGAESDFREKKLTTWWEDREWQVSPALGGKGRRPRKDRRDAGRGSEVGWGLTQRRAREECWRQSSGIQRENKGSTEMVQET